MLGVAVGSARRCSAFHSKELYRGYQPTLQMGKLRQGEMRPRSWTSISHPLVCAVSQRRHDQSCWSAHRVLGKVAPTSGIRCTKHPEGPDRIFVLPFQLGNRSQCRRSTSPPRKKLIESTRNTWKSCASSSRSIKLNTTSQKTVTSNLYRAPHRRWSRGGQAPSFPLSLGLPRILPLVTGNTWAMQRGEKDLVFPAFVWVRSRVFISSPWRTHRR